MLWSIDAIKAGLSAIRRSYLSHNTLTEFFFYSSFEHLVTARNKRDNAIKYITDIFC